MSDVYKYMAGRAADARDAMDKWSAMVEMLFEAEQKIRVARRRILGLAAADT